MFQKLIDWSQSSHSDLPWRQRRTLYRTLVSEIMLQQTTVGTVKNHFEKFLKHYPTIKSLAQTSEEEVCIHWKGLGYYRRARNLRKAAIDLWQKHQGKFPVEKEELKQLSGVGEYTASALLSIGMDRPFLSFDANIERVLARFFAVSLPKGKKLHQELEKKLSQTQVEKWGGRALNEALMDVGRVFCQSSKASCDLCPLTQNCLGAKSQRPLSFPLSQAKTQKHELELLRIVVLKKDKVLAFQKSSEEWLSGQWECPTFLLKSSDKKLTQYEKLKARFSTQKLPHFKSGITKYKITNYVKVMKESEFRKLHQKKKYAFKRLDFGQENLSVSLEKTLRCLKKEGLLNEGPEL